jgi:hypothetical protein
VAASVPDVFCVTRVSSDGVAAERLSASLACGSSIQMKHPTMAMAGSAASHALELANDHLAMLITALIPQRRSRRA